jgi:hypothetical protein
MRRGKGVLNAINSAHLLLAGVSGFRKREVLLYFIMQAGYFSWCLSGGMMVQGLWQMVCHCFTDKMSLGLNHTVSSTFEVSMSLE